MIFFSVLSQSQNLYYLYRSDLFTNHTSNLYHVSVIRYVVIMCFSFLNTNSHVDAYSYFYKFTRQWFSFFFSLPKAKGTNVVILTRALCEYLWRLACKRNKHFVWSKEKLTDLLLKMWIPDIGFKNVIVYVSSKVIWCH